MFESDSNPSRALILCTAIVSVFGAASASDHPTLVSEDSTACNTCHEDLLESEVKHAPVTEDCGTCHEVVIDESGTQIGLAEQEPALCILCHDQFRSAVEAELATPHYPVTESCVTCHDPHAADLRKLLAAPVAETCSTCHEPGDTAEQHDHQINQGSNCVICHDPHGSDNGKMLTGRYTHRPFGDGSCNGCHRKPFGERIRLRSRGDRLCTACHVDVVPADGEETVVHAALQDGRGKASCLSCHDPHMSQQPKLLVSVDPDVCRPCHEAIVAAATDDSGHYPAADACMNCHRPHVASQVGLLESPPSELCLGCHDADDALREGHLGAEVSELSCLECHTPHGSGHAKLLAENVHPPVLEGCDTCHEGASNRVIEDGTKSLCLLCHDEVGQRIEQAHVQHAAMEVAECTDCHNPHASKQANLVRHPAGRVCTECHEEQGAGSGEVAHGVIDWIGCEACHEPHGGRRPGLLRLTAQELCMSCHVNQRSPADGSSSILERFDFVPEEREAVTGLTLTAGGREGHPLPRHRTLGAPTAQELRSTDATFEGEFDCLSCHDPHKGRSRELLRWGATSVSDACVQCHTTK